jgi:Mg-chelatase subunit ChlD
MNPDFPNDPRSALEARLTALLLGELPPDQAAALNELLARDAELSRLRQRLEHAIKLLREVEAAPAAPAETPAATPKLSEARRQQLLQHFKTVALPKKSARPARRKMSWLIPAAAAAALLIVVPALLLPSLARPKSRSYASRPTWIYRGEQNVTLAPPAASLPADEKGTAGNELRRAVERPPSRFGLPSSGDLAARQRPIIVLPSHEVAGKEMFDGRGTVAATPAQQGINGGYAVNRYAPGSGGGGIGGGGGFGTWAADAERPAGAASASSAGRKLGRAPAAKAEGVDNYAYSVEGAPTAKLGEAALPERGSVELNWAAKTEPGRDRRLGFAVNEPAPASPVVNSVVVAGQEAAGALVAPETAAVTGLPVAGDAAQPSQPVVAAGGTVALATNISAIAPTRRARAGAEGQDALAVQSRDSALSSTRMAGQDIGGATPALRSETFKGAVMADAAAATPTTPAETSSIAAGERYAGSYGAGVAGSAAGIVLPKEPVLNHRFLFDSSSERQAGSDKDAGGRETSRDSSKAKEPLSAGVAFFEMPRAQLEDSLGIAEAPLRADALESRDEQLRQRLSEARQQAGPAGALRQEAEVLARKLGESKLALAEKSVERVPAKPAADAADVTLAKPAAPPPVPQPEVLTRENAFSTFSLNVSDVSFKLAAASLEKGQMPEPAAIRSEEFLNAFDYRDPEPPAGIPIAFAWERARYPFAHNRDLLRFSVKTGAQGREAGRALNLVLLLDNSGSMERADRVQIIREALRVLAAQLQPEDKLSVITFARTARLWVDGAPGDQAAQVAERVGGLTPQGGTNLEEAMKLAYETARRHYLERGINRVVLLTDGAANLGEVEPGALKREVEAHRKQGIALDCFGIGWEGYNDDLLETLARNGDGRYGFLNTPEEAATGFAGQLAGALKVAAADVKVQVEFNPDRVRAYRQIGYAKHQLTREQFRDNTVDAAEIGAAESGNALYVIETLPGGRGPVATVRVRYKVPGTADYREMEWTVPYTGSALSLGQAGPALRLAAAASAFAEWLAASPFAAEITPDQLLGLLRGVPEVYGADGRPKQLEWMIRQAKSIAGQ